MKALKKKAPKPKSSVTKKQIDAAIENQGHFVLQVMITQQLLELYARRPNDFKRAFGDGYINAWFASNPYENIDNLIEFCDEISQSITDYYHPTIHGYPVLMANEEYMFVALTKNKKHMTDPETLLDFLDQVYMVGPEHKQLAEAKEKASQL